MTIRTVAAMLALAVVLPGCTSDEKVPSVLPPAPSASPTPTNSQAPEVPPIPTEATAETSQGAAAFARHYMQLLNQAYAVGNARPVQEVSAPGCGGCDNLIGVIQRLETDGQRSVGGEYRVITALAPSIANGDVIVDVAYERPAGQIVDGSNRVIESAAPVPLTEAQLRLVWRNGSWKVQGFRVLEK